MGRISFTLLAFSVFYIIIIGFSNGDFPQLHRALPGANGKPGYRVTSSYSTAAKVGDKTVQNKHGVDTDKKTHGQQPQKTMDFESQWSQAAFYSLISCTLVGLSGILPLVIIPLEAGPSLKHGAGSTMLKLLLSFAVGSLLGDVFLHLLPEAWATVNSAPDPHWAHTVVGLWVVCGILCFMTIEKVFGEEADEEEETDNSELTTTKTTENVSGSEDFKYNLRSRAKLTENGVANGKANQNGVSNGKPHQNGVRKGETHRNGTANGGVVQNGVKSGSCGDNKKEQDEPRIHISGYLNLLANFIDNFTHGLAVAGSYLISPKVGLCTTIAILLHEIPHEVGDFAILLRSGFDRWKAAKAQVVTASGGLLGALTALMCESAEKAGDRTAAILPFTAGGFIYIALVTVVPELLKETCYRESLKQMACVILGVLSMMLVTVLFDG